MLSIVRPCARPAAAQSRPACAPFLKALVPCRRCRALHAEPLQASVRQAGVPVQGRQEVEQPLADLLAVDDSGLLTAPLADDGGGGSDTGGKFDDGAGAAPQQTYCREGETVSSLASSSGGGGGASARLPSSLSPAGLTSKITRAASPWDLMRIYSVYGGQMTHIHLTALLTRLAKVSAAAAAAGGRRRGRRSGCRPQAERPGAAAAAPTDSEDEVDDGTELREFLRRVCGHVQQEVESLGGREASNVLWALAKLAGQLPPQPSLELLQPASEFIDAHQQQQQQQSLDPAWAPCVAGVAAQAELHMASLSPQELALTVHGLAVLGFQPGRRWLAAFCAAFGGAAMRSSTPQGLALTMWALGRHGFRPPRAWCRDYFDVTARAMPHFDDHSVSTMLVGLACFGWDKLPRQWLQTLLGHSAAILHTFSPRALSNSLWALARLGACPPFTWSAAAQVQLQRLMPQLPLLDACQAVWALATLDAGLTASDGARRGGDGAGEGPVGKPSLQLLRAFLRLLTEQADELTPQLVCNALWALRLWRVRPGTAVAQALLKTSYRQLPAFTPQGLSTLLSCLSTLRVRPTQKWLDAWCNASAAAMPAFNANDISYSVRALVELQHDPGRDWCDALRQRLPAVLAPSFAETSPYIAGGGYAEAATADQFNTPAAADNSASSLSGSLSAELQYMVEAALTTWQRQRQS